MTAARRAAAAGLIRFFPGYSQAVPAPGHPAGNARAVARNRHFPEPTGVRMAEDMKDVDDMNDGRNGPRGRTGRPRRRRAGALAAAVAALLTAACGGSSAQTNTFAPGATYAQMRAFAKCMRSNGVPQFPAPDRQGNFSNAQIQALESNNSQEQNALFQCRSVLPNAGTGLTVEQIQEEQQQNLRNAVKAAHCMRAHGITNFPDPDGTTQASGINWQPVLSAIQVGGLSLNTPSYEAAFMACNGKLVGGPIPPTFDPGNTPVDSGPPPGSSPPVSGDAP
jgi:hypothetical protein